MFIHESRCGKWGNKEPWEFKYKPSLVSEHNDTKENFSGDYESTIIFFFDTAAEHLLDNVGSYFLLTVLIGMVGCSYQAIAENFNGTADEQSSFAL